jgi:ribosome maturation factor RimP
MARKADQIQALLAPVVEGMDFELWGVQYIQGKKAVLRIYIDHEEGISVDDCAEVSHQVSGVLDVEDPITSEYVLEVSSPGMDRPLFALAQWARFVGEPVQVRLFAPVAGRRKMTALIKAVEGEEVLLDVDDEEVRIPFEQIDRANLVPVFD